MIIQSVTSYNFGYSWIIIEVIGNNPPKRRFCIGKKPANSGFWSFERKNPENSGLFLGE